MTHRQHARARFVPREDTAGAWEHAEPEPLLPIKYPIHHWSAWKGLTRMDQNHDTRIMWITDNDIIEWAAAFVDERLYWMESHAHSKETWRREVKQHAAWQVLEPRLLDADPRRAFMMMAGMAVEVTNRIALADPNEKHDIWSDFKDTKLWGVYRHHFGDPTNPRMKVYL